MRLPIPMGKAKQQSDNMIVSLMDSFLFFRIREDDMVPILKMTAREIHKLCGKLRDHRLLKM
jgi:hypothetical protein